MFQINKHKNNFKMVVKRTLHLFFIFFTVIILWILLTMMNPESFLLPNIDAVFLALIAIVKNPRTFNELFKTFTRSLTGFLLAVTLNIFFVIFMWQSKGFKDLLHDVGLFIQSVSIIVWIVLFLVIFGLTSDWPTILVPMVVSFPIMLNNLEEGIENVDKKLVEMAQSFGASADDIIFDIILPSLKPYFLSGARSAASLAFKVSVVAEAFTASNGIGYQIMLNFNLFKHDLAIAWALFLVFIMIFFDWVLLGFISNDNNPKKEFVGND